MGGGLSLARLLILVAGIAFVGLGLWLIAMPGGPGTVAGIYTVLLGLALMVGALIERIRYRSDATDRDGPVTPPTGGEPPETRLEPRFRRTDEVFVDPTTRQPMRVWLDPGSGERRYLAESTLDGS
jgi:hypothetical protein